MKRLARVTTWMSPKIYEQYSLEGQMQWTLGLPTNFSAGCHIHVLTSVIPALLQFNLFQICIYKFLAAINFIHDDCSRLTVISLIKTRYETLANSLNSFTQYYLMPCLFGSWSFSTQTPFLSSVPRSADLIIFKHVLHVAELATVKTMSQLNVIRQNKNDIILVRYTLMRA